MQKHFPVAALAYALVVLAPLPSLRATGSPPASATETASLVLDVAGTTQSIRRAAFASRQALATEIGARVDGSQRAVAQLGARAKTGDAKAQAALARALGEVRAREKDLRVTLRETAGAAKESAWRDTQSALVAGYETYAQAVAEAEAAARAEVPAKP